MAQYIKEEDGTWTKIGGVEKTPEEYSTTETRIGTWIDGKPIYRIVLLCAKDTTLMSTGSWMVVSGWSETPPNIKDYVQVNLNGVSYANRIDFSIEADKSLKFYCLASNVLIKAGSPLVLEYTKTTD
ncbi:MAG: hypothetical protein MJ162_07295 [Treponema sp.]|nr:hypothetical protein [Treponema sp.]